MSKLGVTDSASNPMPQAVYDEARQLASVPLRIDTTGGQRQAPQAARGGLPLLTLRQTHPTYDATYWAQLRALYKGGRTLLRNKALMKEVFPPHRDETPEVYAERVKRAFYMPYAGEIIDHIIAALTAEPLVVSLDEPKTGKESVVNPELPPFYEAFTKDCSPEGGEEMNVNQLVRQLMLDALQVRCGWCMYDLEKLEQPAPAAFASKLDQEKAGADEIYVVVLDAASVIDWEADSTGELLWACVHTAECRRASIAASRNVVTETWMYWTRDSWEKFQISYPNDRPPKDIDIVPSVDGGPHTHGRVPLLRLEVPDGLWVMEKLEGLAREHLNKRSGLAWGELQHLLPELYEYLAPEAPGSAGSAPIGENQTDPGRALNQIRGQGYVQVRGGEDRAEFVGPDAAGFTHVLASCTDVRDEMHRVTHQMKLSVDNTAASMQRSGVSKAHDKAAESVVLTFLGLLAREFLRKLLKSVSIARKEPQLVDRWQVKGMEKFDDVATQDAVDQAVELVGVEIPSPTFQRLHKLNLARAVLGSEATPDDLAAIADELEANITSDQFDPAVQAEQQQQQLDHELALKATMPGAPPGGPPKKPGTPLPPKK